MWKLMFAEVQWSHSAPAWERSRKFCGKVWNYLSFRSCVELCEFFSHGYDIWLFLIHFFTPFCQNYVFKIFKFSFYWDFIFILLNNKFLKSINAKCKRIPVVTLNPLFNQADYVEITFHRRQSKVLYWK